MGVRVPDEGICSLAGGNSQISLSGSSRSASTGSPISRRGARPEPALPGATPDRQHVGSRAVGPAAAPGRATGPRTTPGRVGPRSHRALAARARRSRGVGRGTRGVLPRTRPTGFRRMAALRARARARAARDRGRGHRAGVARVPEWLRLAGPRARRSRAVPRVPPEGTLVAARGVWGF
jgi:hypothetical protein